MPINQAHDLHGAYTKLGLDVQFRVGHSGDPFFASEHLELYAGASPLNDRRHLSDSVIGARLVAMTTMHGALPPKARKIAVVMSFVVVALVLLVAFAR